jgi:hypothetical protein
MTTTVNDLTFGVEIETGLPHSASISIGGYHNGRTLADFPVRGTMNTTKWKASADSSIHVPNHTGCEFVSPILKGVDGLENLALACERIKSMGAKVNTTTGVHVHVSFPSNDLAALRRLIHLVAHWEAAMYATTGTKSRERSTYCRSIKTPTARNANYTNHNQCRNTFGDRYRLLNVSALLDGGRPTVEFRCFSGSTNPKKIIAWTMLCLSLVEAALNGSRAKQWDMPETSVARERGEGRGEKLVKALLNDLWVWNGKSRTAAQFGHATYTHAFARKQLVKLARKYDEMDEAECV